MSTTAAQRIAVTAAREALAQLPDYRNNTEPLYWVGRLKAAAELLLDAFAPDVPWAGETGRPAETDPLRCPRCQSPQPSLHPAVSGGGEVTTVCPDPFHGPAEDELACGRCGATREHGVLVTVLGITRCHNQPRCDQRAAARDAEAAQVTA